MIGLELQVTMIWQETEINISVAEFWHAQVQNK